MSSQLGHPVSDRSAEHAPREAAEQLGRAFKAAMAALRRMRGREQHGSGHLSDAQYGLLFCLRDRQGLSSTELAQDAELSPAAVTEMLDGLAHAGLVERARSDRDRRVVLTSITERGQALVEARRAQFEPRFRAAMAEFSDDDLLTASAVLDRLRDMFDEFTEQRGATRGDQPLE